MKHMQVNYLPQGLAVKLFLLLQIIYHQNLYLIKQENEFLHEVFGFTPKRKSLSGIEHHKSVTDKVGL